MTHGSPWRAATLFCEMMDFLSTYHLQGLVLGLCSFLIIGICHPIVIKGEYSKRYLKSLFNNEPSVSVGVAYEGFFL